jgi:hypothetical protein
VGFSREAPACFRIRLVKAQEFGDEPAALRKVIVEQTQCRAEAARLRYNSLNRSTGACKRPQTN